MSGLKVLHQEPGYVVVDKPAGRLVIPGRGESLQAPLREELAAQLGRPVWVVHRLDKDTSGLLLFALNPQVHRTLSMAFEGGRVEKHYLALVRGLLHEPLKLDVNLIPARRGRMRPARPGEGGKAALTLVQPLELFEDATLLDVQPLTGRTHQIRVHLLAAGHPLLVDPQYGQPHAMSAQELGGEGVGQVLARTPLHACRVVLPDLEGVRAANLECPLPVDMEQSLALLRARRATTAS